VCLSSNVVRLALPHPTRSMSSEGRVIHRPLEKGSCNTCGYGFHNQPISARDRDAFYDEAYDLGLRDVEANRRRAKDYIRHIGSFLTKYTDFPRRGASIVEFGCGTGALLDCMVEQWMAPRSLGIEPAEKLARIARAHVGRNVTIREGFAESGGATGESFDLCVSVNVIEHALDPAGFLAACGASIADDGIIITICPDGDYPDSELLFRDHVSSFSTTAFALAAAQAGLQLIASAPLACQQSGFKIFLLKSGKDSVARPDQTGEQLSQLRDGYMKGWRELEHAVLSGLRDGEFAIFGTGEYADLLHAYCPGITDRARFYIVDNPLQRERNGREVIATDAFLSQWRMKTLVAVHPRNWPMLRHRFEAIADRFFHPFQFCGLRSQL
jgi:SAM-dependent methyltransferase